MGGKQIMFKFTNVKCRISMALHYDLQYCAQKEYDLLCSLHHFIEVTWIENIQTVVNCSQLFTLQLPNQYIPLLHVKQFHHNVKRPQKTKHITLKNGF